MECDDCGKFVVADASYLSIFAFDDDTFYGITRCAFCDRTIFQPASKELVGRLFALKVKVFDWRTGEEIGGLNV
jgi:hypothetical protein